MDALARLIAVVKLTMKESGNNRSSSPAQEMSVENKLKTSFVAYESPSAAERPVIDMTSSNRKKNKAVRSELVVPTMLRMASKIVD
ncbi:hypothetical protein ACFX2C_013046 [Malus domestica]